jgi:hypothetical protein
VEIKHLQFKPSNNWRTKGKCIENKSFLYFSRLSTCESKLLTEMSQMCVEQQWMFRLQVCQFCKQSKLNFCIRSHRQQSVFKSTKSDMRIIMFPCFMQSFERRYQYSGYTNCEWDLIWLYCTSRSTQLVVLNWENRQNINVNGSNIDCSKRHFNLVAY